MDNAGSTGGITRGIVQFGATAAGQVTQNNNIVVARGGTGIKYGMYLQNTASSTISNNNVYMNAPAGTNYYGYWGATNCADLTAWTTAGGSATDLDVDPLFVNPATDNYTPANAAMNDLGAPLGVTDDFLGMVRSATTPDMGAFEFIVAPLDMAATAVLSPVTTVGCYTATETVDIEITNYGSSPIDFSVNPCVVGADVTGTVTATLTATVNTGILAPLATQTVSLTPTIDMTANGAYTINAHSTTVGDGNLTNDTIALPAVYNVGVVAGTFTADPLTICVSGTSDLTLAGNAGGAIQWQEATSAAGPWTNIGTGMTTYTTPTLTATTYYRAVLTCNTNSDSTAVDSVVVSNPQIASTMNDTICGPNSATVSAALVPGSGATINWYDAAVGGIKLDTGLSYMTPVISATDTFYAAPSAGGSIDTGGISAWNYNYSGASRGGWFVAQSDYTITDLQVPVEAVGTHQSLAILRMNTAGTPTGTNYTILYNTVNNPITGYIPVNIPVSSGDVIVMIGNRSASATATIGNIAYGNTASNVTVDGFTTTYNRLTLNHVNATTNTPTFTATVSGSAGSVAGMVRFKWTTDCEGVRAPVIAVVNPSPGTLAQATASNASSTTGNTSATEMHADGANLSYYNPTCELVCGVEDAPGGNTLGNVVSQVTIDATVQVWNLQPYTRRWYDIAPTNQGPGDITLYQTQNDFDDYNTFATTNGWPLLPTSPTDAAGIANVRVTKVSGGGLGVGTPTIIAPTTTWDAVNMRWQIDFPVTNFSQFFIHAANPINVPLPVALTSFTATKNGSVTDAKWTTKTEINNSHFNLQRSTDGTSFKTLGRVNSLAPNGNSSVTLEYNYTDVDPQVGHNYYRLQQVDIDGQIAYSGIVDIIWGANGSLVTVYPNPATDKLNVDIATDKASQVEVRILDMSGRTVKSILAKTQSGVNNITVNLDDIATGLYGVQVYTNNKLTHVDKVRKND